VNDEIDPEIEAELGFEPAVSVTGADDGPRRPRRPAGPRRRAGLRRQLGAGVLMLGALVLMGGGYAVFAASSDASANDQAELIAHGHTLYQTTCITCHGANLEGIQGQGPPLIGVGGAAVDFQVSTGRMPAPGQGAYTARKEPKFDEAQIEALAAYVQSIGGGPTLPTGDLRGTDSSLGIGGELFRLNCASCHGVTEGGAPLSAGKNAPDLKDSTDEQIYAAMLTGPGGMPIFGDNQVTPEEKRSIIAYIQAQKASADPGGAGIGRIGPVSEAIVAWVAGVGLIMIMILWIGAKAGD
jgi:ubiquinol-cytochrome c reductase cytochrome c subunit